MVRFSRKPTRQERKPFINQQIKAFKILLLDADGTKLGVLPRRVALQKAEDQGKDLVQIAYDPKEQICTAKIVDYGKYMYEKQKVAKEKRKQQRHKWQKEIKFGYNIGDNDLQIKIKKASANVRRNIFCWRLLFSQKK